jgi:hypothetical protein
MAETDGGPSSALLFRPALFAGAPAEATLAMCRRLAVRGVVLAALGPLPDWMPHDLMRAQVDAALTPGLLLRLLRALKAEAGGSWLVTSASQDLAAAGTAGLAGVVLVGSADPPQDAAVWVRTAPDLLSVPIALVPRGGGCWHQG